MVKDVGYLLDGLDLGITDLGEGGWHGVGKRVSESASGADGVVVRGAFRNGKIVGKKLSSFYDALSLGFRDVHLVSPIVFRGAADVPPGDAME